MCDLLYFRKVDGGDNQVFKIQDATQAEINARSMVK